MKKFLALCSLILVAVIASGQTLDIDEDHQHIRNLMKLQNPGFESGVGGWAASGGVLSTTTSGTIRNKRSGTWDPSAASQILVPPLGFVSVANKGNEFKNKPCLFSFMYDWSAGTLGDIVVRLENSSTNAPLTSPAELNIVPNQTAGKPGEFEASIICTEDDVDVILESKADAALIKLDKFHLGTDYRVGVVEPSTDWAAYTPTTQGLGTITSVSMEWRRKGQDILIRGGFTTGTVSASEMQVGLPNSYTIAGQSLNSEICGRSAGDQTSTQIHAPLCTSGDTFLNFSRVNPVGAENPMSPQNGSSVVSSTTRYSIFARVPVQELSGAQSVNLSTQDWYVSAYLDGASPSLGVTDNAGTFFRTTAAGMSAVNNAGGAPVEIPCEAPNPPDGLDCNGGASTPNVGISFTVPYPGAYEVSFEYGHRITVDSSESLASYGKLAETSETSATIIQEPAKAVLTQFAGTAANQSVTYAVKRSAIFNFSTAGKKVIRFFESTSVSGAPDISAMFCNGSLDQQCYWSVKPIKSGLNQAVALTNIVKDVGSTPSACTDQDEFCRGTYTPSESNLVNLNAGTYFPMQWKKSDKDVGVYGQFTVSPISAGTISGVNLTLPISRSSNFALIGDAGGTCSTRDSDGARVIAVTSSSNQISVNYTPSLTGGETMSCNFWYKLD